MYIVGVMGCKFGSFFCASLAAVHFPQSQPPIPPPRLIQILTAAPRRHPSTNNDDDDDDDKNNARRGDDEQQLGQRPVFSRLARQASRRALDGRAIETRSVTADVVASAASRHHHDLMCIYTGGHKSALGFERYEMALGGAAGLAID